MYIVTQPSNGYATRPLNLDQAAAHVLSYDGHEWEICPSDDGVGYELWVSMHSRNSACWAGLGKSVIFSLETDFVKACEDIFRQVINHADWWSGQQVFAEEEYARMMAEIAADEAAADAE